MGSIMDIQCPYCGRSAVLVTGKVIYPHRPELQKRKYWLCRNCWAYVGTHKNSPTHKPMGRLANAQLRSAKRRAHMVFDPIWRDGDLSRQEAYAWLARQMNMPLSQCHIGHFNVQQCNQAMEIMLKERINKCPTVNHAEDPFAG